MRSIWVVSWLCGQMNIVKIDSAGMRSQESGPQKLTGCSNKNMTRSLLSLFLEWYMLMYNFVYAMNWPGHVVLFTWTVHPQPANIMLFKGGGGGGFTLQNYY